MATSKVADTTRNHAVQMRSEGATYKEIAAALSSEGVTENWCKKNLCTIAVFDKHYFLMEQLIPLAIRPEGIPRKEFRARIKAAYGVPTGKEIPKAIERRTRRALPSNGFIRPDWMEPEAARASQNEIVQNASVLHEMLEAMVAEFCHNHPSSSPWHVRQEIITLATGSYGGGPMVQGRRMLEAVSVMEERMGQKIASERTVPIDEELDDFCV